MAAMVRGAPFALTMGEPGGVGGEIAIAAWRALAGAGPAFFLIDDPARIEALGAPVAKVAHPREAARAFETKLPVLSLDASVRATPGVADPANAPHVEASIRRAVAFALAGDAAGVVTNPVQKSALIAGDASFQAHTEFLGDLTASAPLPPGRARGPVMMIAGPDLKVVPATIHLSLADAARRLTTARIVEVAIVAAESLRADFGIERPRLAIAGLNPHAGENGEMGREDIEIVAPAVARLKERGVEARGPLPADTMFHAEARAHYDVAICMYHDQALIPAKTLAFHEAVNVTLGLPIVRTSPDHGTALDIAGKGVARADSLIAALRLANEMSQRRAIQ